MSLKISSTSPQALTCSHLFSSSKYLTVSLVSCSQVTNLFLMLSMLSSDLPLVSPLLSSRSSITSSLHLRWSIKGRLTLSFICFSQVLRFSMFRGKPSIRNLPFFMPDFSIALAKRLTVIQLGTIFPSTMFFSMISPYSEPGSFRSALRRSPAERWTNLKSFWMRSL